VELAKRNGATARQTVATAKNALSKREEEAREKAVSLNTAIETIWKATVEAVDKDPAVKESGVTERVGNTVENLDELQTQLNAIRARPARLLSELGWVRTLLFAGMVIALPILASWLVSRLFENGLVYRAWRHWARCSPPLRSGCGPRRKRSARLIRRSPKLSRPTRIRSITIPM